MSEIIKRIEARITGNRYMKESSLLSVEETYHKPVDFHYLTEYFVGVKLGHTVKVEEYSIQEATHIVKRALTNLIFGEFRSDLDKLQYQLYDRDFDGARQTAKEIEQRMFYDN